MTQPMKEYRAVIRQNGQELEILKISYQQNKGHINLNMSLSIPERARHPKCPNNYKTSIKNSEYSETKLVNIHSTIELIDRSKIHNYAHVPIVDGKPIIHEVMAVIVGEGDLNKFTKSEDKKIKIVGYNSRASTLVYITYICSANYIMPKIPGFRKMTFRFLSFKLVLYYAFSNWMASPVLSNVILARTKPTLFDDGRLPEGESSETSSVPPEHVLTSARNFVFLVAEDFLNKAQNFHQANGTPCPYPPLEHWEFGPRTTTVDKADLGWAPTGGVIIGDDPEELLNSFVNQYQYADMQEIGPIEKIIESFLDLLEYGAPRLKQPITELCGGDIEDYLRKNIKEFM